MQSYEPLIAQRQCLFTDVKLEKSKKICMQIDGTEADIKSIFKSGKVDTLETIRLEMIEMLRITEDQEIMDEKPKIKVENDKKVTSNLVTLVTPLEVKFRYSEKASNF